MASSTPVILIIADISGYTDFMRRHSVASSHAREITIRLLDTLISRSAFPLVVSEIEGDAVFFYAETKTVQALGSVARFHEQLIRLFRAFNAEVGRLQAMDVCKCEACASVDTLELKQVVHAGEATIERIGRFEKLFSLDVILVHRLLKNSLESKRYILFTKEACRLLTPFFDARLEPHMEHVADMGRVECFIVGDLQIRDLIQSKNARSREPNWFERMRWRLRLRLSEHF